MCIRDSFLGLRTLTILELALKNANGQRAAEGLPPLSFETLPLNDKATFQLLKTANTTAVFQLESKGMKDMLKQAMPDCFEDIIALVALYRPGPMDLIPDFCRRKHGKQRVEYPHPLTEPILKETYGIAVYQEQVMQIAQVVAGYSLGGADLLRRAMGKKKVEEMDAQRKTFVEGATKNNMTERQATELFDLLEKFAGYGFNKSHAAAYALVAYQTAYLKAHYPAAFLASTMSADMNNTDSVHTFYDDCAPNQIEVLPPDINQSAVSYTHLEILGNQEVVMKQIGTQLARVPGIIGATVLGDGDIVLVLNAVQLANREALSVGSVKVSSATPAIEQRRRIALVVDDSLTMRKVLSRVLEREDFEVLTANDGMDAVQKLQQITPDIILTDIEMPRMDGFEFSRHVRDNQATKHTPLIVISSRTADKHRNLATEIGVNAFLGKPVQDEDLIAQVNALLGQNA